MPGDPGYMLSEQAIRKIVDDHRRLAHEVYQLKQELASTHRISPWPRELYWGKTIDGGETYPTSGNAFWVKLIDRTFDESAGTETVTDTIGGSAVEVVARTVDGSHVDEDTVVRVERRLSREGWRYWIVPDVVASGWPTVFLLGGSSYNSDGSNRDRLKGYGDGYSADDRMGYVFFDFQYGDAAGVGLTIETNKTSVNSGSNAETSALFSLSTTGLYRIHLILSATDNTTIPAATSSNVTSGVNSAGSPSHTHEVARLTDVQYQSNMAATLQSRVGAGAWSSVTGWTGTTLYTRTGAATLYRYELYQAMLLVANTAAGKEYRLRLSVGIYPQTTLADPADHAERVITGSSVQLSITRVDDDPTMTSL